MMGCWDWRVGAAAKAGIPSPPSCGRSPHRPGGLGSMGIKDSEAACRFN